MNIKSYLQRIRYRGPTNVSVPTLHALHQAHLFAVPFENLSIHIGERIALSENWLYRKVVERNRGGFCYELNGLFAALLRNLGFSVSLLAARVADNEGFGQPFDHLVLRVDLEESWLVDVGFGDSFLTPLPLQTSAPQTQKSGVFRVIRGGDEYLLQTQASTGEKWQNRYTFSLTPHPLDAFKTMCTYHQTSKDSSFTQKMICTLPTKSGRITLSGDDLIETHNGTRTVRKLSGPNLREIVLEEMFDIKLGR